MRIGGTMCKRMVSTGKCGIDMVGCGRSTCIRLKVAERVVGREGRTSPEAIGPLLRQPQGQAPPFSASASSRKEASSQMESPGGR